MGQLRLFQAALSGYTPQQLRAAVPPAGEAPKVPLRLRIQSKSDPVGQSIVIDAALLAKLVGGAA